MTLKEIYRIALARGLTAKQAGAEFKVNHESIAKMKGRSGFPSLVTEYECSERKALKSLNNCDLRSYYKVYINGGKSEKELSYIKDELKARKIKV